MLVHHFPCVLGNFKARWSIIKYPTVGKRSNESTKEFSGQKPRETITESMIYTYFLPPPIMKNIYFPNCYEGWSENFPLSYEIGNTHRSDAYHCSVFLSCRLLFHLIHWRDLGTWILSLVVFACRKLVCLVFFASWLKVAISVTSKRNERRLIFPG